MGLGNIPGNIWGIIFGIIIGAFILFLICRELFCWYLKTNRIVVLIEEQNSLLKGLLGQKSTNATPFSPTHKIHFHEDMIDKLVSDNSIKMRSEPNKNGSVLLGLKNGTDIEVIEKVEDQDNDTWVLVKIKGNITGWCNEMFIKKNV